jgi:hypothetical protein
LGAYPKYHFIDAGIAVSLSVPADQAVEPALQYSFITGDTSQLMAPSQVEWRVGNGVNTGRNVLAGADYLYDSAAGRVGFRVPPSWSRPTGAALRLGWCLVRRSNVNVTEFFASEIVGARAVSKQQVHVTIHNDRVHVTKMTAETFCAHCLALLPEILRSSRRS